jgi:hypothetical protein
MSEKPLFNQPKPPLSEYQHLLPYGYAPGSYIGTCNICKKAITDIDKRACNCRECAQDLFDANIKRERARSLLAQMQKEERPPIEETISWDCQAWATIEEARTFAQDLWDKCDALEDQLLKKVTHD